MLVGSILIFYFYPSKELKMEKLFTRILTVAILILGYSCQSTIEEESKANYKLAISIDSILVDSKGEIIDLQDGLTTFDIDEEQKYMYKFNTSNRHGLEIINLDDLVLEEFISFEKEGPTGTSNRVFSINLINEHEIAITNNAGILVYNIDGKFLRNYPINGDKLAGDSIPNDHWMSNNGDLYPDELLAFHYLYEGQVMLRGLALIDVQKKTRDLLMIDDFKALDDYTISVDTGDRQFWLRVNLYNLVNDGKYIFSNDVFNGLHYYDLSLDSIIHKSFTSNLSPNKNEVLGIKSTSSLQDVSDKMKERNKSIRFKELAYDDKTNQYFRLSYFAESETEEKTTWKFILTVFDKDFNQIYETDNVPFEELPETYFFKDGKMYIYKNMEDELGFLRLSFTHV